MNFQHTTDNLIVLTNISLDKESRWFKYLTSQLGTWVPNTTFPQSKTLIDPSDNSIYCLDVAVNLAVLTVKKSGAKFKDHYAEIVRFISTSIANNGFSAEISNAIEYKLYTYLPSTVTLDEKLNKSGVTKTVFSTAITEQGVNEYVKVFSTTTTSSSSSTSSHVINSSITAPSFGGFSGFGNTSSSNSGYSFGGGGGFQWNKK